MTAALVFLALAGAPDAALAADVKALCALADITEVAAQVGDRNQPDWFSSPRKRIAKEVSGSDAPGVMLWVWAKRAGVKQCALADRLNAAAGTSAVLNCFPTRWCMPPALDDAFAEAFEKLPDAKTRVVEVELQPGEQLAVSAKLKSLTRLIVNGREVPERVWSAYRPP